MHVIPFLTGLLAAVRKRGTDDGGQYTIWTSTPTTYYSYRSTEIVTVTAWIPCPILTSTITTTECSECESPTGPTGTNCVPKSCTVCSGEYVFVSSTTYFSWETAPASVTINGVVDSTDIPASDCTSYEPFTSEGVPYEGLPSCGSSPSPIPPGPLTCQAKPCTIVEDDCCVQSNAVYATSYAPGEEAPIVIGDATTLTPAQYCSVQTSPAGGFSDEDIQTAEACGPGYFGGDDGGDPASTITYTYVTDGATVVATTTLPGRDGVYHLQGYGAGNRGNDASVYLLFWVWVVVGVISGTGMLIL